MRSLSDKPGSNSISQAFLENPDSGEDIKGKLQFKNLIKQANAMPLLIVFKSFGININEYNRKAICPFPSHNGGAERSPSFLFYKETNSFYCFGCKTGGGPVNFLSSLKNISKKDAALKLLESYSGNTDSVSLLEEFESNSYDERTSLLLDFSKKINEFISLNNDQKSIKYADKICFTFDLINSKHKLDNNALKSLINKLYLLLGQYK